MISKVHLPVVKKLLGRKSQRKKASSHKKAEGDLDQLQKLHLELWQCLDLVNEQMSLIQDLNSRVCLAVLEEDLAALVDECEDLMISGKRPAIPSLEARTETIVDEIKMMLLTP